ncbi:MAG TPA: glycosyltransferase [Bacteroidales bacterium]|nr:glycosyltransferase [Bacteroidales bacterium]
MGFASAWLREKEIFPAFISDKPAADTGIIIVVPSYNEPRITTMLDSLAKCEKPGCATEVIIVVNAPANASDEHKSGNRKTIKDIESWKKQNEDCFFRLFYFEPHHDMHDWGVGLARKSGMDEALRHFSEADKPEGVILCLDADCTVAPDYLTEIFRKLFLEKDRNACSIYFEHPLCGTEYPENFYKSIVLYELHLRYYYQALCLTGFPFAFQTTGSAMAVKAITYMKAGGMNRRQAGEDFYFIQKLVPAGGYFYLNTTAVYPASRTSYRVPFGTGATMEKLTKDKYPSLLTYRFDAFSELKSTFSMLKVFFESEPELLPLLYSKLHSGIQMFTDQEEWSSKILEIKNNTNGFLSFQKRFFTWFNMFKIVKYLNFVHQEFYKKEPVEKAAAELLRSAGIAGGSGNANELLVVFRSLERNF